MDLKQYMEKVFNLQDDLEEFQREIEGDISENPKAFQSTIHLSDELQIYLSKVDNYLEDKESVNFSKETEAFIDQLTAFQKSLKNTVEEKHPQWESSFDKVSSQITAVQQNYQP